MSVQRFRAATQRSVFAIFERSHNKTLFTTRRVSPFLPNTGSTVGNTLFSVPNLAVPLAIYRSYVTEGSSYPVYTPNQKTRIPTQTATGGQSNYTNDSKNEDGFSMVHLSLPGGVELEWPGIWLRENCQCNQCMHPDTRQRLVDTFSIPFDIEPSRVQVHKNHVEIDWANDGHRSRFNIKWLENHRLKQSSHEHSVTFRDNLKYGPKDLNIQPTVDYDEVMCSEEGVRKWTSKIYDYGYSFVDGCPATPEATQKLLERISFIRPTHYGGFWDFTSDLTMKDMAYTTDGLGAHTDTTYFTEPAGLQMFHLLSHIDGEGGESLLVDGFAAAEQLHSEDPDSYNILQSYLQGSHASGNEEVCIQPSRPFPVLNHLPVTGELYQVRWNNEDRSTKSHMSARAMARWYHAAAKFNEIIRRDSMEHWFQLKPGKPLIFDNWRMLHGRSPFTGKRRMCGAYINHDDFMSRYLLLRDGRRNVLDRI